MNKIHAQICNEKHVTHAAHVKYSYDNIFFPTTTTQQALIRHISSRNRIPQLGDVSIPVQRVQNKTHKESQAPLVTRRFGNT